MEQIIFLVLWVVIGGGITIFRAVKRRAEQKEARAPAPMRERTPNNDEDASERLRKIFSDLSEDPAPERRAEETDAPAEAKKMTRAKTIKTKRESKWDRETRKLEEKRKEAAALASRIEAFEPIKDKEENETAEFEFDAEEARKAILYSEILERKYGRR